MSEFLNEVFFDSKDKTPLDLFIDKLPLSFEKIFAVRQGDETFVLLHPLEPIKRVPDNSVILFNVFEDKLMMCKDKEKIDSIYSLYEDSFLDFGGSSEDSCLFNRFNIFNKYPKDEKEKNPMFWGLSKFKKKIEYLLSGLKNQDVAIKKLTKHLSLNHDKGSIITLMSSDPYEARTVVDAIAKTMNYPLLVKDGTEYQKDFEMALQGSHETYARSMESPVITFIKKNRECVIAFMNIDRAHESVERVMTELVLERRMANLNNMTVESFEDAVLIFHFSTPNELSVSDISSRGDDYIFETLSELNENNESCLTKGFLSALKTDSTLIALNDLSEESLFMYLKEYTEEVIDSYNKKYDVSVSLNDETLKWILLQSLDKNISTARKMVDNYLYKLIDKAIELSEDNIVIDSIVLDSKNKFINEYEDDFLNDKTISLITNASKEFDDYRNLFDVHTIKDLDSKYNSMPFVIFDDESLSFDEVFEIKNLRSTNKEPLFLISSNGNLSIEATELGGNKIVLNESYNINKFLTGLYESLNFKRLKLENLRKHRVISFSTKFEIENSVLKATIYGTHLESVISEKDNENFLNYNPNVLENDVIGLDKGKELAKIMKEEKTYPVNLKINQKRFILFNGNSGCGKTYLAKHIATVLDVPIISITSSDIHNSDELRKIINLARKHSALIFIDEADFLLYDRFKRPIPFNSELITTLLKELDGFDSSNNNFYLIMATNLDIGDIDLSMKRRFDEILYFDNPDAASRYAYIKHILSGYPNKVADKKITAIVNRSDGMSYSKIKKILENAIRRSDKKGMSIDDEMLEYAYQDETKMNLSNLSDSKKMNVALSKASQAVLRHILDMNTVFISIDSKNDIGYEPSKSNVYYSLEELRNKICILLAPRASMIALSKEIFTCLDDDLKKANEIARDMVMKYGMCNSLLVHDEANDSSIETIRNVLESELERAKELVDLNADLIRKIANDLFVKNYMDEYELEEVLDEGFSFA